MSKAEFIQCDSCGAVQMKGQHFKELLMGDDEKLIGHLCANCIDVARQVFWLIGLRFEELALYRPRHGIKIYQFHYGEMNDDFRT